MAVCELGGSQMSSLKEPQLTASNCEDAPQSPEGTAALKRPFSPSPGSRDATPQKKKHSTEERNTVVSRALFCSSPEPSDSNGSAGQEVQEPLLVRLPEESLSDGTVQQEVQDVEVDPLSGAQPELSGTTSGDDVSQQPARIVADPDEEEAGVVLHQQPEQPALESNSEKAEEDVLPELIPWKTLYNKYLEEGDDASLMVILQRYGLTKEHPQCMLGFIRCVAAVQSCHCEVPTAALVCLQGHSLYPKAEVCIARRLPDLDSRKARPAYVRAVMAAIVLLAGGVRDIQELVDCLQRPSFPMSLRDILEILYSMATLLYAMRKNEVHISNRFHYSVSYCLYHLENSPSSTPSINDPEVSSSEGSFRPILQLTSEQQEILKYKFNSENRIKIVGFAGTGKSSTVFQYARKWSNLEFLYITFNRITKDRLSFRPENVTCQTFHSLAYNEVGKQYKDKFIRDILINKVSRVLSNREANATEVVQTLEAFFASADESITVEHTGYGENVEEHKKQIIVEEAEQIWTKMKELSPTKEKAYHMTFDGYLKLWQLQRPSLSKYNIIVVDDAQDCTPAMMNIVLSQKCAVILVGNLHQQIYTFRGADNTVLDVPNCHTFNLTQNFRFGYKIAYIGATLLDVSRKIRKTPLGNNRNSDVSVEGKVACLSRTNASIFDNAVKVTDRHPSAKIHFLGGIKAVGLAIIEDLCKIKHPELNLKLTTKLIKEYEEEGLTTIDDFAAIGDEGLSTKINIVENHGKHVLDLVKRIRQCHVRDPKSADYILGTVHKAKGMEFDTVKIDDDFMIKFNPERLHSNKIDEWNLLYVAVTRAKKHLIVPRFFAQILKVAKEHCVQFELATALHDTTPLVCGSCNQPIPEDSLLIPKRILHPCIADDPETPQRYLCPSCATRTLGPIAELTGSSRAQGAACRPENIEVSAKVHILLEDF